MITSRTPVALAGLPTEPSSLAEDLRPLAAEIITRHGLEEWHAAILTHEVHGHLGVFSLLGVKMGVRAREILNASLHELTVVSHAGSQPPLSCMNDGLQVATGATLGRGTIRVAEGEARPEAAFAKGAARVRMRVRGAIVEGIHMAQRQALERFGPRTPAGEAEARRLAVQFWLELDRRESFEELPAESDAQASGKADP